MERGKPSRDRKARSNDPRQRARSRADYPGQRARTRPGGTRRWDRPDAPRGFEPNRRADLAPAIPRSRRGSLSPRGIRGAHSRWFGRSERFPNQGIRAVRPPPRPPWSECRILRFQILLGVARSPLSPLIGSTPRNGAARRVIRQHASEGQSVSSSIPP